MKADEIQELDRRYFKDNPDRRIYIRRAAGRETEFGNATIVTEIRPEGVRVRAPLRIDPAIDWRDLDESELVRLVSKSPAGLALRAMAEAAKGGS